MKSTLNPYVKPWYPKGCNPCATEYNPSHFALKAVLSRILPNRESFLICQGWTGGSPVIWDNPIIPISPSSVAYFNTLCNKK
jgi:hypothetical protein